MLFRSTDGNGYYQIGLVGLAKASGAVTLARRSANGTSAGQQQHPAVAADFNGDFAVAWESDHTGTRGVWARSFSATGSPGSAEVEVSTGAGAGGPSVGIDDQRAAVVGWSVAGADPAVWARGLNPDGGGAHLTIFDTPSGGAVFSAGSITYPAGLLCDPPSATITANVLQRFLR